MEAKPASETLCFIKNQMMDIVQKQTLCQYISMLLQACSKHHLSN